MYDPQIHAMTTNTGERGSVKAAETSFAIIELIEKEGQVSVSEVADRLSIAKSTAHKHLHTLEKNEYLIREDNKYLISLKHLKFGQHALNRTTIAQESETVIKHLAEETGEAIWVAIEEHGRVVYVNKALGERAAPSRTRSSMAKYQSTEKLWTVLDRMVQVHGGTGVDSDLPLERWLREARVRRIGEGPYEVHLKTMSRNLLKSYDDPDPSPSDRVT